MTGTRAATKPARASDRLVTPAVVMVAIVVGAGLVAFIAHEVTTLAGRGVDPAPVLDLVAKIVTAMGALGTLVLQLVSRSQASRTERNTAAVPAIAAAVVQPTEFDHVVSGTVPAPGQH